MARDDDGNAVSTGLIALLGVGLVVGLLISGAALAVTQVLGLGEGGTTASTATAQQSMDLPTPTPTPEPEGPAITLAPVPAPGAAAGDGGVDTAAPAPTPSAAPVPTGITLTSPVTEVGPGQRIPLSGSYPSGDGAVLQVERLTDGAWTEFPVDARVSGGIFSTYVQTSQTGQATFRMRDTATGTTSNEVPVTIG